MTPTRRAVSIYRLLRAAESAHPGSQALADLHEELRLGYNEQKGVLGINETQGNDDLSSDTAMPANGGSAKNPPSS